MGKLKTQVKTQACEIDEGPLRQRSRVLTVMGLEEKLDLGRPGVPGPSYQTCQCG